MIRYRKIDISFICLLLLASCTDEREVVTDIYFIHNDLEQPVSLVFSNLVPWDTCATGSFVHIMYDSICPQIPPHKVIRLHPAHREYKSPNNHHYQIDPGSIFGQTTKLIVNSDTIVWQSKYAHMFSSDTVWSIYNYEDWSLTQDNELPFTFYSTFIITLSNIERSLP